MWFYTNMPPKKDASSSRKQATKPFVAAATTTGEEEEINQLVSEITSESDTINKSVFEDIIKKYIKQCENNLKGLIKSENASLKAEIMRNQQEIETLKNENNNLKKQAEMNKTNIESLKGETASLKSKLAKCEEGQASLAEEIEERTNRQLRKTLVFRGIPEQSIRKDPTSDDSGMRKENWADTEEVLAKAIADTCDNTTLADARGMIERAHRSSPNPRYTGSGPRPIFVAFYDWKSSEYVKRQFRFNATDIRCDNKYGPRTSARRNMAMKERKRLKDNGSILNGYVDFPARLMVRDSNAQGAKYYLKKDFSKEMIN